MTLYTMPSTFFHDDLMFASLLSSLQHSSQDEPKRTVEKKAQNTPTVQPSYSSTRNDNETYIEIELPGVEKQDISMQLDGRKLEMTAKRFRLHNAEDKKDEEMETNETDAETQHGTGDEKETESMKNVSQSTAREPLLTYRLSLRLNERANASAISSDLKCGLLGVHIPKVEEPKPVSISIGSRT